MRKLSFSLFLLLFGLPVAAQAGTISAPVHNSGLVGYWSFDIGEGGTTAYDMSGQGRHGTLTDMDHTSDWVDGQIDSALDFDGNNDYLNIADPNLPTGDFTYSAWIHLDDNSDENLFVASNGSGGNEFQFYIDADGSLNGSRYWVSIDNDVTAVAGNTVISTGIWHLITITRGGSAIKVFIDGVQDNDGSDGTGLNFSSCPLIVGTDVDSGCEGGLGNYLNGRIDDVRIYNRALSAEEVARLYRVGTPTVNRARSVVTNGLVGHWTFDGNDTSATQTYDSSGQENHGALNGGLSGRAGKLGQALKFGGTDGYVTINDASELDFSNGSTISIAAWVRPDDFGGFYEYVLKGRVADNLNANYAFRQNSERKLQFYYYGTETPTYQIWTTDAAQLSTSTWTHVVAEYTLGTGSSMKMYVNGQQVSGSWTQGSGNETPPQNNEALVLGSKQFDAGGGGGDPDTYYHGTLDDLRIYNRALSQDEINALYVFGAPSRVNAGSAAGPDAGLVGHWTFDGNDTDTLNAYDVSGQSNHGTLTNGPIPAAGRLGQAIEFDGDDDHVVINGTTFPDLGNNLSVAVWVKPSVNGDFAVFGQNSAANAFHLRTNVTSLTGSDVEAYIPGTVIASASAVGLVPPNKWTHIVYTRNGTGAGTHAIYVNGESRSLSIDSSSNFSDTTTTKYIGTRNVTLEFFEGVMDDVRVYNRALTPEEITQLYNLGR